MNEREKDGQEKAGQEKNEQEKDVSRDAVRTDAMCKMDKIREEVQQCLQKALQKTRQDAAAQDTSAARPAGRRKKDKAEPDTRRRVIAAALELILREGVAAITWRKLSEESRLSPGTLTYYYKSLDDILVLAFTALMEETLAHMEEQLCGVKDLDALCERLADILDGELGTGRFVLLNCELACLALRKERYRALYTTWMALTQTLYARFMPKDVACRLDALTEGMGLHRAMQREQYPREALVQALRSLVADHAAGRHADGNA